MSIDIQRQLDIATAYFLAGERCSVEMRFGTYAFHSLASPTITNYAFAVELALKLLHLFSRGVSVEGHNLKHLFESLPKETRNHLPVLQECGEEISLHFVDWRYAFERDFLVAGEEDSRRAFIECYREIKRLKPQFVSSFESRWGVFEPDWIRSWPEVQPRWELRLVGA